MKSFPFEFEDRELHIRRLDQDTKEDLLDRVVSGRLNQARRMFKKGYLDLQGFEDAKQGAYIKWGTPNFIGEFFDEENAKAFVRAIVKEELDDAMLLRLVKEQKDTDSPMALAIIRMVEDDAPKAPTPLVSA